MCIDGHMCVNVLIWSGLVYALSLPICAIIHKAVNPLIKHIIYVFEQGQLPGLEVLGALGVKL